MFASLAKLYYRMCFTNPCNQIYNPILATFYVMYYIYDIRVYERREQDEDIYNTSR